MVNNYLSDIFAKALNNLGDISSCNLFFEEPKNPEHGDATTNIAMQLAKFLKKPPRIIAEELITHLEYDKSRIEFINVAGAGFINIKFTDNYYLKSLKDIYLQKENQGKSDIGKGIKVNVEYVSVNPTGLLHLGHGRNASIGDTIANLYTWCGYDVTREYYFNNAGNQMNNLAKSVFARYIQQQQNPDYPFPDDGYHGEYIKEIAIELEKVYGNDLIAGTDEDLAKCRKFGEVWCFEKIKKTLSRMNIIQEVYYNEDSLYSSGKIKNVINDFKNCGLAYEKDGALWLKLSEMGLKDDRVIVKSTGEPTYRLPDIAYHREKFLRGFDILVDIFGSDHIATVSDVLAGIKSLGFDSNKVKVLIHQFVTLTENGEQVKMSKRTGKSYTLDDLLDEVGPDVVRFFLIMRGISTHLEFDLDLARQQSDKNPVFYLQYAHARICSVIDTAKERGIEVKNNFDEELLKQKEEIELVKTLLKFKAVVESTCEKSEPQILAEYLRELASAFHIFYHECRIIGINEDLMQARLNLAAITKTAMKNGLSILGLSAPERM